MTKTRRDLEAAKEAAHGALRSELDLNEKVQLALPADALGASERVALSAARSALRRSITRCAVTYAKAANALEDHIAKGEEGTE